MSHRLTSKLEFALLAASAFLVPAQLCFARKDKNGKLVLYYPFQSNATFVHYCHNRIHRQCVSNSMRFYLKHSAPNELLDPNFKVADLEKMSARDIARMVHHAEVRIRPLDRQCRNI